MSQEGYLPVPKGFATRAIHSGQDPEKWDSMCVVPPIVLSATFQLNGPRDINKYLYGRLGNPSRDVLEECLASLEGAKHSLCFASGMGCVSAVLGMFRAGDHIISVCDVYAGTRRLFTTIGAGLGFETSFVDCTVPENIENAIKTNTKLIWLETPTNPTLNVMDIKAVAEIAKKNKLVLAVDNTFLTPYLQRPLELGADLSVYSLTKYMNGHSDVIMGAIMTNDSEHHEKLRFIQHAMGIVPSPFDCFLVTRGLKTLELRMRRHASNGMAVAKFLEQHPKVSKVVHPGLASHPQHELSKKQTSGHSGMVALYLRDLEQAKKFLSALKVFTLAASLGGYESLVELPALLTHASVPPEERKRLNIEENLVRLSVGLEDVEDLVADLEQALAAV